MTFGVRRCESRPHPALIVGCIMASLAPSTVWAQRPTVSCVSGPTISVESKYGGQANHLVIYLISDTTNVEGAWVESWSRLHLLAR